MDLLSAAVEGVLSVCPPGKVFYFCPEGGSWWVGYSDEDWLREAWAR